MKSDKRKAQDEIASNGLTRREMHADLMAKDVSFDPWAPIGELQAQHAGVKRAEAD